MQGFFSFKLQNSSPLFVTGDFYGLTWSKGKGFCVDDLLFDTIQMYSITWKPNRRADFMAKNSQIEWTHHTFNPWWGCTKVSPGCKHCYAEAWSKRTGQKVWGPTAPRRKLSDTYWKQPHAWNNEATRKGI